MRKSIIIVLMLLGLTFLGTSVVLADLNNGTVSGATLTTDRFGNANSAYSFNGSSDYIKITANSTLDIYPDLTICFWFKRKGYSKDETDGGSTLIDRVWKDNNSSYSGDVMAMGLDKTGKVSLYYNYDRLESWPSSEYFSLIKTVSLNNLYFVCIRKKGESITSWFDGEKTGDITLPEDNNPYVYSGNWYIGSQIDKNNIWAPFNGEIDDVRIYNRAISESEIEELYKEGTTPTAPTATTNAATNVASNSATLNGKVNANGGTTTAWFEYGITSGTYSNTTSTQTISSGWSDTSVTADISGLSSKITYYYRLVAQNIVGTTYGSETSFTTIYPPTVTTGLATNVTMISTTLNGTVNANGTSTTAWFEYGKSSGTYDKTTTTQDVSGSSDTSVSIYVSGLSSGTGYYYRLVAQNNAGVSYGSETSFSTITSSTPVPTPTPTATSTPTTSPAPTLPPLPTPQVSPSPSSEGIVFGIVNDQDEQPLKGVTIKITGNNSSDSTETDENGYYEFNGLSKGNYTLTYEKEGFLAQTQDISLKEGEVKDLGTVTMEQVVKGKISGYVANIKGDPIESVRLKLKGVKTKVIKTASSDADGFFEFTDLDADTYVIFAKKKGYKKTQQKVALGDGESTESRLR